MDSEKISLVTPVLDSNFYSGQEISTGEIGTSGISRLILHGLTIISVLIASGCTIYGTIRAGSAVLVLPFLIVFIWLFIHFVLIFFAKNGEHDFHPPAWFIFVSSGQIFIQSLVVMILTL
jgi:hypothetical protein